MHRKAVGLILMLISRMYLFSGTNPRDRDLYPFLGYSCNLYELYILYKLYTFIELYI